MSGQLFIISGLSGAGKSTIIASLKKSEKGLGYSISHTSRKPRRNEKNGIDYFFVDRNIFNSMIKNGSFVEWAKVYNDYYGTSFSSLTNQTDTGLDVLLDVDSQGAKNIKMHFEDCVLIYVLPPSYKILEKRLRNRGTDDEDVIKIRMEKTSHEIKNCLWYNYIIINNDLEKAVSEVQSIIISERCRASNRAARVKKLFNIQS